jgi:hypothetical protein
MALDIVADEGPLQDVAEARRLAGDFAALLARLSDSQLATPHILTLPRGVDRTLERLDEYLTGAIDATALRTFVARRPWTPALQVAVLSLPDHELSHFAQMLRDRDYLAAAELLGYGTDSSGAA